MRFIDMSNYPRKTHYEFFKSMAYPYMGICANVDVTRLIQYAKQQEASPFLAYLWAAANAANEVPELRQRIVDDRIVEFDHCDTSHTVSLPDGTFANCRTDCRKGLDDFLVYGRKQQQEALARGSFDVSGDETDLIFVSCVPWVSFTQITEPTPIPADSNPRLVFGKFIQDHDRILLPLHIQCNHALVDGLHLGRFYQALDDIVASVK